MPRPVTWRSQIRQPRWPPSARVSPVVWGPQPGDQEERETKTPDGVEAPGPRASLTRSGLRGPRAVLPPAWSLTGLSCPQSLASK